MDKQCCAQNFFASLLLDPMCANIKQKLKNIC